MQVILAEDSALLREGLARLLSDAGLNITRSVADATTLLAAVESEPPDVVVTDIRMPPTFTDEGLSAAIRIRTLHPDVAVLVLSQYSEAAYAERLLRDGTTGVGYLLKDRVNDISALHDAILRLAGGESVIDPEVVRTLVSRPRRRNPLERLTDREQEVLALMAEGRSNQGIGARLHLSAKTVETHVGAIMSKLDLPDSADDNRRVAAVVRYLRGD
jgi:DNA-binding NarL/FixJ family response regulator